MQVYNGSLKDSTKALIQNNSQYVKNVLLKTKGLNAPKSATYTIDETVAKYNPGLTKDEIKAWVWYRKKQGIPMTSWKSYFVKENQSLLNSWLEKEIIFFDPTVNDLVPFAIYTFGNVYEKISKLKKQDTTIIKNYGQTVYDKHLDVLEKAKPEPLSIQNPIVGERPVILAISTMAKNYKITDLRDDLVGVRPEGDALQSIFKDWLREYPKEQIKKVSAWDIVSVYLQNENKPRNIDQQEWDAKKKNSRDEGERLFKIFLHEALTLQDQIKIDQIYNEQHNAISLLNHKKIPIGVEISRKFGDNDLDLREAQRDGIAFMELVGSGIIAYDVGVGKTMTAIAELCTAIKNGKCKRPLVVVPNPTYENWISEMFGKNGKSGILTGTGIKLNKWYNLGKGYYENIDFTKKIDENTITLVTTQGFEKIGFNEETSKDHFEYLKKVVIQDDYSERKSEKEAEKAEEIIGVGLKDTIADIDDLGIDYICVDEAHNFKKVFTQVKADEEGKQFNISIGGDPAKRAIKLFFLANYIQRKYGRNVMLLTATPFTNSPLEIYSMLSFVAYEYMKNNNIQNLKIFFEQYIHESSEWVVSPSGSIRQDNVVKSFNNRISLQKLINSHINFKTGEEANIKRPCKINIPKFTKPSEESVKQLAENDQVLSYLKLNETQQINQKNINHEASKGSSKEDPGRILRLMGMSLNNALSPFLLKNSESPVDDTEFVENSPKILYTVECIKTVQQWHNKRGEPLSGQVIYINRGTEYFRYIKSYLMRNLNLKTSLKTISGKKVDEVEILTGKTSKTKKESIKEGFNGGQVKILIGTATIKEGINLQEKSTCLYNLYPDWNPTDIRQLEGRIWRQKNENAYVRIVMPLMENSMDVFIFQKLEEKTARINQLWEKSDRGNVLDEDSLDPEAVKYALITDLEVLFDFEMKKIKENMNRELMIINSKISDIGNYFGIKTSYENYKTSLLASVSELSINNKHLFVDNDKNFYYNNISQVDIDALPKNKKDIIERYNKVDALIQEFKQGNREDKFLIALKTRYNALSEYESWDRTLDSFKTLLSKFSKIKRSIFKSRGVDENTNIEEIIADLNKEKTEIEENYQKINSSEFKQKLIEQIQDKKEKFSIKSGNLDERVKEFSKLNYLMSYKINQVDVDECKIPVIELPVQNVSTNKSKQIQIAKAKAIAIKIKLKLAKAKLSA